MKPNGTFAAVRWMACFALLAWPPSVLRAADSYDLLESADDSRIFKIDVDLQVTGKVYPEPGADKALKLSVEARFGYGERRLAGTGRDAETLRSVRYYDKAEASIHEQALSTKPGGEQLSKLGLRSEVRLIVARGKTDGIELFSPSGPLSADELQLLKAPSDSLAALALLPDSKVEIGESWQPADWLLPMLTNVEAAEKSTLKCTLASVDKNAARVDVVGEITGITLGVPAHVKLTGHFIYDLEQRHIRRIELVQTEKRSIGTVSPGLDVSAQVILTRMVDTKTPRLTDKNLANVPLEPNDASLLLLFDVPVWKLQFFHDRNWHLRYQTPEVIILKLMHEGRPIAQCNLKKLPDAEPGKHIPEEEFQGDIRKTLGKDFQEFVEAEKLKLRDGLFIFRAVAVGSIPDRTEKKESAFLPMQWNYYLVANPDGRQVSLAFAVEPKLVEEMKSRDLMIVGGLEFQASGPRVTPTKATK